MFRKLKKYIHIFSPKVDVQDLIDDEMTRRNQLAIKSTDEGVNKIDFSMLEFTNKLDVTDQGWIGIDRGTGVGKKQPLEKSDAPKRDGLKIVQFINGVLDVVMKFSVVSTIFGAFIVRQYLSEIGFKNLFTTVIGLQNGLLAIIFGFGLIAVLMWMLLVINPWLLWQLRKSLKVKNAENVFSLWYIFALEILIQSAFLAVAMFNVSFAWFYLSILVPFISIWLRQGGVLKVRDRFMYAGSTWLCLVTSVFPLLVAITIIEAVVVKGVWDIDQVSLQVAIALVWVVAYSFLSAAVVSTTKIKDAKSELPIIVSSGVVFGALLFWLLNVIPQFFIHTSMSAIGMRQTQSESTWWSVDGSAYQRIVLGASMSTVEPPLLKNIYICAYSPLLLTERLVLCPSDVKEPKSDLCHVFLGSEARPLTKSVIPSGGECAKKN